MGPCAFTTWSFEVSADCHYFEELFSGAPAVLCVLVPEMLFCGFTNETRSLLLPSPARGPAWRVTRGGRERFGREGRHKCLFGGDKYEKGRKIKKGGIERASQHSLLESVLREKIKEDNKYTCKGMVDRGVSSDPKTPKWQRKERRRSPSFRGAGKVTVKF